MTRTFTLGELDAAASLLHGGGVVAYPTEAVFGFGCDPHNHDAFRRLFAFKQRPPTQGVLLIAETFEQVERYIDRSRVPDTVMAEVLASWPGPITWIFPRSGDVPDWVAGSHEGIALRVTAHAPAAALCRAYGGALVSTSANPHGQPPARSVAMLREYFGDTVDGIVDAPLGQLDRPTMIRDALTGAIIRS
ncbi:MULTISPECIES: L-threonylcarbamoyladenylate synthase [Dyella]|uniref:Threonylcarbamoyl-AMP synthase n=2 Tax=Dyella TaxID=231454 RepID=A0A4R0YIW3_9GAMM|nr:MULTISPECIES: Sua5/YciO/YrdC/YwlC family protein [Dyella]TBR36516.1 tRNA threonylcarbamoyladenosine biosynthesis protein RimN [Dyella terrae]TCI08392.1 tRNA threonylcarbamoyladenosine biosynthesis protein RimN [Dyella soli]